MSRASDIARKLLAHYPEPKVALEFSTPFELLVAAILSAQCTDARVNQVTRELFRRFRTPADYVHAPAAEIEEAIRSTGFYRQKARTLIACCRCLVENWKGAVPRDLDALTTLPGVGRKTANLVRGAAFGEPGIAVDTHVQRVAQRLGLAMSRTPDGIERDLMRALPTEVWTPFTLATILHGRAVCTATKPLCGRCPLAADCLWPGKSPDS